MKNPIHKFKAWKWRRMSRRLCLLVIRIDCAMKHEGWPAWKKRQWWRDVIKSPRARDAAFTSIYKALGGEAK